MKKLVIALYFLLFAALPNANAQQGADTLDIGINGENMQLNLPKDSLFSKEITFEDSGRIYKIRISGIPKNAKIADPVVVRKDKKAKTKAIRNLFLSAAFGGTLAIGENRSAFRTLSGNFTQNVPNVADINSQQQRFIPGFELNINLYQKTKPLKNNWKYRRSIHADYYTFGMVSNIFTAEYTAKTDNSMSQTKTLVYDSLLFSAQSNAKIRYEKFRFLFPYMFEKTYTMMNGKQVGISAGVAFSFNLFTSRNIRQGFIFNSIYYDIIPSVSLTNALVPMVNLRYDKFVFYGQVKHNPSGNVSLTKNPQRWIVQSGLAYHLY